MNPLRFLHKQFLHWLGPTILCGASPSTWFRLLHFNKFRISPRYLGRAAIVTGLTVSNAVCSRLENAIFGKSVHEASVHPPLFVLGCWRSGTTHLHNLLAHDERFAFPNSFQVMNPHVFLFNESWNAPIQNLFYPSTRAMDDVRLSAAEPQEDEFAIAAMCGFSPMLAMTFWNNRQHYNRYTTLNDATAEEIAAWSQSLEMFVKKLSFKYDRPLVLKSPAHTARIQHLLKLYPEARFVMIHRSPYEVAISAINMYTKNLPLLALQRFDTTDLGSELVEHFSGLFNAYFDQRDLIPKGRLIEIPYQELDAEPIKTLRRIYDELDLPDFAAVEPAITAYIESLAEYKKNEHPNLPPDLKRLIIERWPRCFSEWGYKL